MKYSANFSSKLPLTGATIFSKMSKLAKEYDAINLGQGFPDFNPPEELIDLVYKYMQDGQNQYAPMAGITALRKVIVEGINKLHSTSYDVEDEITITAGATQAIYTAISSVIKEDDEVIIFTPAYDCYVPAIQVNGGNPVYIQLQTPDYKIDWELVKKMINHKTRMIIINTPHNPTGTVLNSKDMEELEKIVSGNNIFVLSDEVYQHIIFDNQEHQSVARFPKLAEHSFIIGSFGKTFHCTGWKVGYCLAPENLMKEFRKIHQYMVFSVNTAVQYALAEYIQNNTDYANLKALYQQKRDLFLDLIKDSKFTTTPAKGSYFQLLNYEKISTEEDMKFAERLIKEFKIAAIPISAFYYKKVGSYVLRFCFAKKDETLKKAAELINKI